MPPVYKYPVIAEAVHLKGAQRRIYTEPIICTTYELFETFFLAIPASLLQIAKHSSERLLQHLDEDQCQRLWGLLSQEPTMAKQLICAITGSEYVLNACCREPSLLFHWLLADAI